MFLHSIFSILVAQIISNCVTPEIKSDRWRWRGGIKITLAQLGNFMVLLSKLLTFFLLKLFWIVKYQLSHNIL